MGPETREIFIEQIARLKELSSRASSEEEARAITSQIAQISRKFRIQTGIGLPERPDEQAREINPDYVMRPHLEYISSRLHQAVRDVERGQNRHLVVSLPPRAGKSTLISQNTPLWLLRRHPEWKIVMTSHDGGLTAMWARNLRREIEDNPGLGVALERDFGAGAEWFTMEKGGVYATSVRGSFIGRGARVLIIDDPVKDFVEAHNMNSRQTLWDWWLSVAQTRLEPPYLVLVVMTRWHEDDFAGRLLGTEYEGDPREWENIKIPAIAEENDLLGRAPGEPLTSPLLEETPEQAEQRWAKTRNSVGTYNFSSMYQQRPAPAKGAIFDTAWWRYWTTNPDLETEDGRVTYLDPSSLTGGRWLDSWDTAFKSAEGGKSGWVVGQRWVRDKARRYLIAQKRGRWSFTQTIDQMQDWVSPLSICGNLVHERLIEERANGAAIIDVLNEHVSGIKAINPTVSKEARARAVTPEIESGHVYLPHPGDPGNEWVSDLLSELRNFPHDLADDQVDALTQALGVLRDEGRGRITVPGSTSTTRRQPGQQWQASRDVARSALSDLQRPRGYGPTRRR